MHPIKRIKAWWNWRSYSNLTKFQKFMVLIGLRKNYQFERGWCPWLNERR